MAKSKTDIRFAYLWVPGRYADRVQRASVLYPLVGRPPHHDITGDYTPEAMTALRLTCMTNAVLRKWRERHAALVHYGWELEGHQHQTRYVRNCCPAFVYTRPASRPCGLRHICPFCYARWVREVWCLLDSAFPNPRALESERAQTYASSRAMLSNLPPDALPAAEPAREEGAFPYHLIERRRIQEFSWTPTTKELAEDCPDSVSWVRHLVGDIIRKRTQAMRGLVADNQAKGAFSQLTIEPWPEQESLRLTYRQLFMVPADAETRMPDDDAEVVRHVRPTRAVIFQAVARTCRYPCFLMTANPEHVAIILRGLQGRVLGNKIERIPRLSATYGWFRQQQGVPRWLTDSR